MENISSDNLYLIDLSYAQTPADIVFELSTILEQEMAHNQRIYLKLGNVDLNQSQLLSINSLINSINSTMVLVSSDSQQTELAAATLGFLISNNLSDEQKEAQKAQEPPAPQYVTMTEHLEEEDDDDEIREELQKESQTLEEESMDESEEEDEEGIELGAITLDSDETALKIQTEEINKIFTQENDLTEKSEKSVSLESSQTTAYESQDEEQKEISTPSDEIQAELDSIFDSEMKLESILGAEEAKNYPSTQDASEIEIPEEELSEEDYKILKMPTKFIKQTVRSGQVIKAEGNVVIIGDCHPGSEVHAQGDITVWGALGGIAHAGSEGNKKAKIRALQLNAIQLRIADLFARRPDASNIVYVEKTNTVTPEEARILNDNIVILKLND